MKINRLCLVTSDYHFVDEDKVCTTSAFMKFVPELLAFTENIEICCPVHASGVGGFSIESERIRYIKLPPSRTIEQFMKQLPRDLPVIVQKIYQGVRRSDLVWINGPHPLLPITALVCLLLAKPYVLWIRGDIMETTRAKYVSKTKRDNMARRLAVYLDRSMLLAARRGAVLVTGKGLSRYLERSKNAIIANSSLVKESDISNNPKGVLHNPVRLLWAGQLRPVKGLAYLLEAVKLLIDRGFNVHLTIVGDGEQGDYLRDLASKLGLKHAVEFPGYVPPGPALKTYFDRADIYVLPSLSEGIPKVLLEAMAAGLPIVATKVGGIPDIIEDGVNGLLVEPGDARALAFCVQRLIQADDLRMSLSSNALRFARDHTAEAEVRRIHKLLTKAYPYIWRTS